ncbi:hypothetical protein FF38_03045, partial [Lucilia cuprina]
MKKQGRSLKEQYYSSPYGIIGSTISFTIVMVILGLEVWVAIWPVPDADGTPVKPSAEGFFEVWLSLPIVLAFFLGHKLWYRRPWAWPSKVDLVTGARIKTEQEMSEKDEDELALMEKPNVVGVCGTQAYANVEASLSLVKVIAIIGFCIFGIISAAGGGPTHHYFGTHYWHDPGSFTNGVKGTVYVFVNAAFAMSGIEAAGLASAECEDPGKALPRAVKQSFWRINLFYIISL